MGVRQGTLAKAANLNPSTLSEIENEKSDPQFSTVTVVAGALLLKAHVNLFEVLGRQLESDPLEAVSFGPTVPTQPSDTQDAHSAHALDSSSAGGTGVPDNNLVGLERAYLHFAHRLDDRAREQLAREMELAGERYMQRMREEAAKKASGE